MCVCVSCVRLLCAFGQDAGWLQRWGKRGMHAASASAPRTPRPDLGRRRRLPACRRRWVPIKERSRSLSLVYSGMYTGSMLGLALSPQMIASWGWSSVFYVFGAAGLAWYAWWDRHAAASPQDDPAIDEVRPWGGPSVWRGCARWGRAGARVWGGVAGWRPAAAFLAPSPVAALAVALPQRLPAPATPLSLQAELRYITRNTASAQPLTSIPWRLLLSKPATWALIVCHFCHNWGTFILLTWMPTYYNQVCAGGAPWGPGGAQLGGVRQEGRAWWSAAGGEGGAGREQFSAPLGGACRQRCAPLRSSCLGSWHCGGPADQLLRPAPSPACAAPWSWAGAGPGPEEQRLLLGAALGHYGHLRQRGRLDRRHAGGARLERHLCAQDHADGAQEGGPRWQQRCQPHQPCRPVPRPSGGLHLAASRHLLTRALFNPPPPPAPLQIGFLGPAFFLTQLGNITSVSGAVACMMASQGLDAFSQSGLYSNHADIGPRYAGVLLGLSNTAGVLAGVLGTAATGFILQTGSWKQVRLAG